MVDDKYFRSNEGFTFSLPGYENDVSLDVFGKRIHAHSVILKIHSAFFRKFMDQPHPPKQNEKRNPGSYPYEYVTVVDDDGTWGLEKAKSPLIDTTAKFKGTVEVQRAAFLKLIFAMYGRPYTVSHVDDILQMVRLADFYLALPILSSSLTAAFFNLRDAHPASDKPGIIRSNPFHVLIAAEKLRNPVIFRECLVHLVARWNSKHYDRARQQYLSENHPHLYDLVKKSYADVCYEIMDTETKVMRKLNEADDEYGINARELWTKLRSSDLAKRGDLFKYYKGIFEEISALTNQLDPDMDDEYLFYVDIIDAIAPVLKNNLQFSYSDLPPLCYCAEIKDADLPWDINKVDW